MAVHDTCVARRFWFWFGLGCIFWGCGWTKAMSILLTMIMGRKNAVRAGPGEELLGGEGRRGRIGIMCMRK